MDLADRSVALYGRFSPGVRDRMQAVIEEDGGHVARDLTRRSDLMVVGALATALIDSGALGSRLASARARDVPVRGERAFAAELDGERWGSDATLPLATAMAQTALTRADIDILAVFDLVALDGERCRFGDAGVIRTAGELVAGGRSKGDVVRILARARDLAPKGRHRIVLTPSGEAALEWGDGLTSLEGQGLLPLDEDQAGVDDLFEAAQVAEAEGHLVRAAHLYDMAARSDRADATAPYNFGNIKLAEGAHDEAVLAYRRALERDQGFLEARYNLAQALEASGKGTEAAAELIRVLDADPKYADAVFNLAQLRMNAGEMAAAMALFERYLALDPPREWAQTARKAILYCLAKLSA